MRKATTKNKQTQHIQKPLFRAMKKSPSCPSLTITNEKQHVVSPSHALSSDTTKYSWAPLPSCAVSNDSSISESLVDEDEDDDCWDSIEVLDVQDILEDVRRILVLSEERQSNNRTKSFTKMLSCGKLRSHKKSKRWMKNQKKLDLLIQDEQVVL